MNDALDFDKLEALDKARTPGPWSVYSEEGFLRDGRERLSVCANAEESSHACVADVHCMHANGANAAYLVAACNALPAVIERVRELEGAVREANAISRAAEAEFVRSANRTINAEARVRELEAASRWIPSTEGPPVVGHAVECCDPNSWNPPYMGDMTMEIAADIRVIDGTGQERWESGADWPFWREIGLLPEVKE